MNRRHYFLGSAPSLGSGSWAGVKLDGPCGKHDGFVQGKRYFKCQARHGVLLKQERVKPILARLDVATGPLTRSQTAALAAAATVAAKVSSTATNRFMRRASEQVHSDPWRLPAEPHEALALPRQPARGTAAVF